MKMVNKTSPNPSRFCVKYLCKSPYFVCFVKNNVASLTVCLIKVDIDPFQLEVTVSLIDACGIEPMFVTDHLPKLERETCFCFLSDVTVSKDKRLYKLFKKMKYVSRLIFGSTQNSTKQHNEHHKISFSSCRKLQNLHMGEKKSHPQQCDFSPYLLPEYWQETPSATTVGMANSCGWGYKPYVIIK